MRCNQCPEQVAFDVEHATIRTTYVDQEDIERIVWNIATPCSSCPEVGLLLHTCTAPKELTSIRCLACSSANIRLNSDERRLRYRLGTPSSSFYLSAYDVPLYCNNCHAFKIIEVTTWGLWSE